MDWLPPVPPWSLVEPVLRLLVLPGVALGGGLLALACLLTPSKPWRTFAMAFGVAAGFAVGNYRFGRVEDESSYSLVEWWPATGGWDSLFPATLLALAGGAFAALLQHRSALGAAGIRWLTGAACAWWLAPEGEPLGRTQHAAILFVAGMLMWETTRGAPGRSLGLLLLILPWGGTAALVLIYAHSARFCDLATLLTACLCGAGLVVAWWRADAEAILGAPAFFLPALMLAGLTGTYSEVPKASFILAALAPCALVLLWLPQFRRCSPRAQALLAFTAICLPCAIAAGLAMRAETLDFGE